MATRMEMIELDTFTPPVAQMRADLSETIGRGDLQRVQGHAVTPADALTAADLNWGPAIKPLFAGGLEVPADVGRAVTRDDTGATIGIVGAQYHALDHRPLFALGGKVAGETGMRAINIGHRDGGAKVFCQLQSDPERLAPGVDVAMRVSLFTSHDGSLCHTAGFSAVNIVCQNTFRRAFSQCKAGLKIRHTAAADELMAQATDIITAAGEFAGQWSTVALGMLSRKMTDAQMVALASMLVPGDSTRSENARRAIMDAYQSGPGAAPGTVWGAAQAITHYTSHTIGRESSRADTAIFGTGVGADMQTDAWWTLEAAEDVMAARLQSVKLYRV